MTDEAQKQIEIALTHLESQRRNMARMEHEMDVRLVKLESYVDSERGNLTRHVDALFERLDSADKQLRGNGGQPGVLSRLKSVEETVGVVQRIGWVVILSVVLALLGLVILPVRFVE